VHDGLDFLLGQHALEPLLIDEFTFYEFGAGSDALPVPFAQIVVRWGYASA
jgi:hypothetical protein